MYSILAGLVNHLAGSALAGTQVIHWGAPVPVFGDPATAQVATLGLNPSNREFVDDAGVELRGTARRFHTLKSLGLASWHEADARHLQLVLQSCHGYFHRNPYDRWFRRLDELLVATGTSYYADYESSAGRQGGVACHLDVIPYATHRKWTQLNSEQRSKLLHRSGEALGLLLRDSRIRMVVLNGQSVVDHFETLADIRLDCQEESEWTLARQNGRPVQGLAYRGVVGAVGGADLGREVLVLGYNHNLQSSFGVTRGAIRAITAWIGRAASEWQS